MADRISIRELATIAGVSRTTVSLALRGSHEVSEATRHRIHELAREHDYRCHPAINALMQQVGRGRRVHDQEVIAFVRSGPDAGERAQGQLEILAGASEEAHRLGYRLEVFWAGYKAAKAEQLGRVLYHRGIRGVIWGSMPFPHPPVNFPWQHFAPIACTLSTGVHRLPTVATDYASGMAMVIDELARRGARRIGIIGNSVEDSRLNHGWALGLHLYLLRGGTVPVTSTYMAGPPGRQAMRECIREQKPDVVIMPQSFFSETPFLEGIIPRVSLDVPTAELGKSAGLYQNATQIGRHSVRSLAIRLSNGILGLPEHPFSVVSQASFVEGKSLGDVLVKGINRAVDM
ncbi:MAG: LacI family DNA-binding transcriptional regulator [Candidatus Methylacidiphilales bacterium]